MRRGAGHIGESHEGARERKGVLPDTAGGAGKQDDCCQPAGQGSGGGRKAGDGRQRRRDAERNQCGGVPGNGKGGCRMIVKAFANYGFAGTEMEFEEEFPDDATDEEIEETMKDIVYEQVDWSWRKEG